MHRAQDGAIAPWRRALDALRALWRVSGHAGALSAA